MGWADNYIKQLKEGKTVKFRPRGNSMSGRIESGQLVTVEPVGKGYPISIGDAVLCKVNGHQYLHIAAAIRKGKSGFEVQIQNNKGFTNGWTKLENIFGRVTKIEK